MQKRQLGSQGCQVSMLGLGCMGMSAGLGHPDVKDAQTILQAAVAAGVNFFDSAHFCAHGDNEKLLGSVFGKGHADGIIIASKCGLQADPKLDNVMTVNHQAKQLQLDCEQSLKNLKRDAIDLYYLHGVDDRIPIEEAFSVLADLVKAGKIRYLGLSDTQADVIERAHSVHPLTSVQGEYSLWTQTPELRLQLARCRELGIGFVANAPLGRGYLTGKYKSPRELPRTVHRQRYHAWQERAAHDNQQLLAALQQVANHNGCSLAQCALAWVLVQGDDIIPIPGTKQLANLQENLETVECVSLGATDVRYLNQAAKQFAKHMVSLAQEQVTDEEM